MLSSLLDTLGALAVLASLAWQFSCWRQSRIRLEGGTRSGNDADDKTDDRADDRADPRAPRETTPDT